MRGLSLAETIVAMGVALVLSLILLRLMVSTTRTSELAQLRLELQQSAVLALQKMATDVGSSPSQGLTIYATGLGMHPVKSIDSGSHTVWAEELVLYAAHPSEKALVRALKPLSSGGGAIIPLTTLSPTQIGQETLTLPKRQVLCDDLTELRVTPPVARTDSLPGQPLRLWLKLTKLPRNGKPITVEMERVVSLRMGAN